MSNKQTLFLSLATALFLNGNVANAGEISTNTAQMQAMDKITGRVSVINVPVNSEVKFGSFSIVVRDCKTRSPEETPENFAFVDVADILSDTEKVNIFKGWMLSSSQALNAVEHPVYDVWLLKCIDTDISTAKLMTLEELIERDSLPKQNPESYRTPKNKKGYDFVDENLSGKPIDLLPASIRAAGEEAVAQEEVLPINPVQKIDKIENETEFSSKEPIAQSLAEAITAETQALEKAKEAELSSEEALTNNQKEEKNNQPLNLIEENMSLTEEETVITINPAEENLPASSDIKINPISEETANLSGVSKADSQPTMSVVAEEKTLPTSPILEENIKFKTQPLGAEVFAEGTTLSEPQNIDIRDTFPLQPEIIIKENIAQEKTEEVKPTEAEAKPKETLSLPDISKEKQMPLEEDNSHEKIIEINTDMLSDLEEELAQPKTKQ